MLGSKNEITWEHFRDAAREDRAVWKILLKSSMNNLAAYHMQQSVEKYLKAVIMKYDLSDLTLKELGHMPIIPLLQKIECWVMKERGLIPTESVRDIFKLIHDLLKKRTDEKIEFLWEKSLEIDFTDHEIKTFHKPLLLKLQKALKTYSPNSLGNSGEYIKNQDFKSRYATDPKHNSWFWIGTHIATLMRMYPHEDIGRYPTMIDSKLSSDVYGKLYDGNPRIHYIEVIADRFYREAEDILKCTE